MSESSAPVKPPRQPSDTDRTACPSPEPAEQTGPAMIGIDGGGTKTEFVLFRETGHIQQRLVLSGCNPNLCGIEQACAILKAGIDRLRSLTVRVCGIYGGLSGFLSGDNGKRILAFLTTTYPELPIVCNGDILNVSASATNEGRCITAICGTGSLVCAINGRTIHRVGGWGYLFDRAGSGFDIGRDALTASLAERDGIGPKTAITRFVENRLGTTVWNSLDRLYAGPKAYIASFSHAVFDALREGDAVAQDILRQNMEALCEKIRFAAERYDGGHTVILSGGLLCQQEVLLPLIRQKLNPGLSIRIPELPQIYGACVLCCQTFGAAENPHFRENFTADYQQYAERKE